LNKGLQPLVTDVGQPLVAEGSLITYFRRGKLQKFFLAADKPYAQELDFLSAAEIHESSADETKQKLPEQFYELLDKNKEAFIIATTEEMAEPQTRRGKDSAFQILKILKATLKNTKQLTEEQELYLKKVFTQLEEGGLPKQTAKETLKALSDLKSELANPLKVLATLQAHIPERLLESHYAEYNPQSSGRREVILSLYLRESKDGYNEIALFKGKKIRRCSITTSGGSLLMMLLRH
jgi:hypothetical protein